MYIENDGSNRRDYSAYLHREIVPSTSDKASRYMLRVEIINRNFDTVLREYESKISKGELKSSAVEYNGILSTRIDGAFDKELHGSVVLMRVRDKTIRLSTDAESFRPDFNTILSTVKFVE